MDLDDELYGDGDLYAGAYEDDDQQQYEPSSLGPQASRLLDPNHGSAASYDQASDRDHYGANQAGSRYDLEAKVKESQLQAEKWRNAFREVAQACGFATPAGRDPDVSAVVDTIRRLRSSDGTVQEELRKYRRKEAALQIQLAEKNLENLELIKELNAVQQAADPSVVQLKQLMLDPAVNKEFQRLKSELEDTQKELKQAQEELQAVQFTQESKIGRQLMAKCRSLQEENDEMGRELSEGKLHQVEVQLALAKEHAEELRRSYLELEDHCTVLDEEAEELQREIFALRKRVSDLEVDAGIMPEHRRFDPAVGGGRGMDFRGRGGFRGRGRGFLDREGGGGRGFLPQKRLR